MSLIVINGPSPNLLGMPKLQAQGRHMLQMIEAEMRPMPPDASAAPGLRRASGHQPADA